VDCGHTASATQNKQRRKRIDLTLIVPLSSDVAEELHAAAYRANDGPKLGAMLTVADNGHKELTVTAR
jgi:hypothetical protein